MKYIEVVLTSFIRIYFHANKQISLEFLYSLRLTFTFIRLVDAFGHTDLPNEEKQAILAIFRIAATKYNVLLWIYLPVLIFCSDT